MAKVINLRGKGNRECFTMAHACCAMRGIGDFVIAVRDARAIQRGRVFAGLLRLLPLPRNDGGGIEMGDNHPLRHAGLDPASNGFATAEQLSSELKR
jgi:hypothetical protein